MTLIRDFAQNIKSDGDLVITGDLQVTGTTTTLETATLNVEDKNITLNYSTGDSSATASGAGITIQDAINSSTDATILWNTTSNQFDFSNKINVAGDAQVLDFYGQDMHVLNAAGNGWHQWGTRANDKIDLDIGGITVGGDIVGSNFQLTGTTSNSNSLLRSILLASAPEQEHVAHPYLLNDLATFRPRGGTVNISGLNAGVADSGITNMFRPNARFLSFNGSDYSGTEVTITLTDIPATLTYLAYFGMVFGAGAFKPQSAKIEVSTDGGSNWTVILNSSASDTHYHSSYGGNNNQVNAIRYTIGQPASTTIRIVNLYAYNYASLGMDGYFLPRDGGEVFGNIGVAETPSDFGTGYSIRIGNAAKGGSLVLRSHDDGNSGLLQFVHKDGASAMQLGSSTDTAPSPDEPYGYLYNYSNDFRIQGDNGTHVIVDGNGDVTFNGVINATTADASFNVANFYSNETQANINMGRDASQRLNFYVTDSQAYIRYFQDETDTTDHSVNFQIQSSSSGPNLFKFNSYLESGDDLTVQGNRILAGQYSSGHIATWGGQRSSGGPVMGYGVWPATTGSGLDFVSSSDVTIQRSAFILNGNNFQWWNADGSTTALDSPVTLDLKMALGRSGLTLNPGTGLVVGSTNVTPLGGTQVYINKDGNTGLNLQRWGEGDLNDASSYRFRIDQNFKFIANDGTATDYGLSTNGDTLEILSDTGVILFKNGGGLNFNEVQTTESGTTPSSAILDDYEEGTWTPLFGGATFSNQQSIGYYTKIGDVVYANYYTGNATIASVAGNATVTNLPFTSDNGSQHYAPVTLAHYNALAANSNGYVVPNSRQITLIGEGTVSGTPWIAGGSGMYMMISVVYKAL